MNGFCSNQVRNYCKSCNSSNYKRHGCSKAQACLNKILHIISSIEPPPVKNPSSKSLAADGGGDGFIESNSGGGEYFGRKRKGFDIDLNMSLVGPFWESGESTESLVENGDLSACSFVYKEEQEQQQQQEKTTDGCSDITNSQVDSVQEEEEELKTAARGGGGGGNDCLGLLIAAAELISSGDDDDNDNKKQVMMSHLDDDDDDDDDKNNKKWRVDEGDTSAVVRSTRGRRSQVLPHRYRDSVVLLEPWKRLKTTTTTTTKIRSRYN